MTWWVFSLLDNYRPPHYLRVLAVTRQRAHMFIRWWKTKPARHMIYRNIRGSAKWCGYKYLWAGSHLHEQNEPGDTYNHTFGPIPLDLTDHVWYYLFSYMTAPPLEHQGPLIHVPPPEPIMPAARIFHSIDQPAPGGVFTILTFDSVAYDDYYLYDPADPTKLTVPAGGLYAFGACARFDTIAATSARMAILLNGAQATIQHSHAVGATGWAGATFSLHTVLALRPGDFIQCQLYHMGPADRVVKASPNYSPHFWIAQIGAYPVSPP